MSAVAEKPDFLPTRESLIEKLKDLENQETWREFFDLYWKLIYGVAIKSGFTHSEAEEVVQETIIGVTKGIARFKRDPAIGSFKSWLPAFSRRKAKSFWAMVWPILKDAVAAGEGALRTWIMRAASTIRKSSTRRPSGVKAWALTPAPAG